MQWKPKLITTIPPILNKAVLVITAPNNPDGDIPSATELHELLQWTQQNNVSVVADLTYSELIFSGTRPDGTSHKENYSKLVTEFYKSKPCETQYQENRPS